MTIFRETYAITYAHHLPKFPDGHKCRRMHGHTARVVIDVEADDGPGGYAFDHAELDAIAAHVLGPLDHQVINDIEGLGDGLAETILLHIAKKIDGELRATLNARLLSVEFHELSTGGTLREVDHVKIWRAHAHENRER